MYKESEDEHLSFLEFIKKTSYYMEEYLVRSMEWKSTEDLELRLISRSSFLPSLHHPGFLLVVTERAVDGVPSGNVKRIC